VSLEPTLQPPRRENLTRLQAARLLVDAAVRELQCSRHGPRWWKHAELVEERMARAYR
jgi:hypothetical protein